MEEVEGAILSEETPGQGAEGRGEEGEGKGEGVEEPVECSVLAFGLVRPSRPRDRGPDTQHAQGQQQRGARAWGRPLRGHLGNTVLLLLVLGGGEVVTAERSQAEGVIIEAVFGLQLLKSKSSLLFLCYHSSSFVDVHIVIDFVFYIVPPPSTPPVDRSTRSSCGSRVLQSASIYN